MKILCMVLNDGKTYSNIEGCKIVWVEDDSKLDQRIKDGDYETVLVYNLNAIEK